MGQPQKQPSATRQALLPLTGLLNTLGAHHNDEPEDVPVGPPPARPLAYFTGGCDSKLSLFFTTGQNSAGAHFILLRLYL